MKKTLLLLAVICALGFVAAVSGQKKDLVETPDRVEAGQAYHAVHALLIGVNKYPSLPGRLQLSHAVDDVKALKAVLIEKYGFADVKVLTDEQASLAAIKSALAGFADNTKVKPDDLVLVYFSGHGQTVPIAKGGAMGFLVPSDAKVDLTNPTNAAPYLNTCLPMREVWDDLDASPAKHALVIADACFSGLLTQKRSLGLSNEALAVLLARRARQVIAAGSSGQQTVERDDLGHGLFTAKLLDELNARAVLKGKAFTASNLFAALQEEVTNATGGKQTPQIGNFDSDGEVVFVPTGIASGLPKPETPKAELPKSEPPKSDPPKTATPKTEPPKTAPTDSGPTPAGLNKTQGEYYKRLQEILADAPNRFANLARKGAKKTTKPDGNVDVEVYTLAKLLPGFDFGGVSDASAGEAFLYFDGTPRNWVTVFEDYKKAVRALIPGGREQHFDETNWRINDKHFQISLRRDKDSTWGRGEQIYHQVVLTILYQP